MSVISQAVIGLGFGDEGKGVVVNHMVNASQLSYDSVIRFSGGHQVGHTVVENGIRHVFSNFGSGTLKDLPTIWSKYCTIDPIGILNETKILKEKGIIPKLHISSECPVTTPYDKLSNVTSKDNLSHGTCGVGFGATIKRDEDLFRLRAIDIIHPKVFKIKLDLVKQYYKSPKLSEENISDFNEAVSFVRETYGDTICAQDLKHFNAIYEGSQGLLLDQNIGFFPHVTRSNTGTKNLVEMEVRPDITLVTRAYQTRHGNGPMTNTHIPHNIKNDPLETNTKNTYQGKFRKSVLDLDLLKYALANDSVLSRHMGFDIAVTCLEHIDGEFQYTNHGKLNTCNDAELFGCVLRDLLPRTKNVLLFKNHALIGIV